MGEVLGKDQHGDIWVRKSSGGGCFTSLGFWIMAVVVAAMAIGSIFSGLAAIIGNGIFSPYHVFTTNHNDAVRGAVRNFVGQDKYVGLFETDAIDDYDYFLKADDPHFTNVNLEPELGSFPGKAYTVDGAAASSWFEFDNVGIQRQGHCLLIAYIKPTPGVQHTIYARVLDNGQEQAYTFHIKSGEDSGSVDIGTPASDQYSYKVYIQGDDGTPLEAIVVDRSGQVSSPSTSAQATPTPIRLAAKYSGTWVDEYLVDVAGNTVPDQAALEINKTNTDGSFEGKWYDTFKSPDGSGGYDDQTNVYSVKGVSVQFDQTNRFSQIDSVKLQNLQQQVGESGALLQFTITGIINDNAATCAGEGGVCDGTDFYGVLSNGSVQGVWWNNTGTNATGDPDGTFKLSS